MGTPGTERDRWLRLALQIGNIGAFEIDLVTRRGTWSDELLQIWGVERAFPADFVGYCWEHTYPGDVARVKAAFAELRRSRAVTDIEFRIRRPDGVERWIRWRGQILEDATTGHPQAVGVNMDVTEARRAAAALGASEARFSVAFRTSPMAMLVTRAADGRFVDVNDRFLSLSGYSREEVLGKTAVDLQFYGRPEERGPLMEALRSRGALEPFEFVSRTKSGQLLVGLSATAPIEWGREPHFLSLILDITEHKRLEEALRVAQKMEAFGQLAAGVAHDFNNLLTVISGSSSLAREDRDPEALATALGEIDDAVARAKNLTRQLLTFSRRQAVQLVGLDLNEVIAGTVRMLRRVIGEDIALVERYAPQGAPVHADRGMVEQVLLNLSVNARDAMPRGGRLEVQTEAVELPAGRPRGRAGSFVRLTVRDTGCGIAPDDLARVFEPFFTTKDVGKGTGLGLATVFGIVEQHLGWIEVESALQHGTAFHVFWPRSAEPLRCGDAPHTAPENVEGREAVLVAEDEEPVRWLLRRTLERHGYVVHGAASGPEALALWAQHKDCIALLLTDLVMPDGLSGTELARRLRVERPELKVLYSSGYSPELLEPEALAGPSAAFIAKPYAPGDLLRAVRTLLDAG
jgi:two-component system, cell cycle sensor histidine kinase and response regulator CckA